MYGAGLDGDRDYSAVQDDDSDCSNRSFVESGRHLALWERAAAAKCTEALSKIMPVTGKKAPTCILVAGGTEFYVHQGVLEVWSTIMWTQLARWTPRECDEPRINIMYEFGADITEMFVYFLYHGGLKKFFNSYDSNGVHSFWGVARMGKYYVVPELVSQCLVSLSYIACGHECERNLAQRGRHTLIPSFEELESLGFDVKTLVRDGSSQRLLRMALKKTPSSWILGSLRTLVASGVQVGGLGVVSFTDMKEKGGATPKYMYRAFLNNLRAPRSKELRTEIAVQQMMELRYSVEELLKDGCTSNWFQRHCERSADSFRSIGYSLSDLIKLGYKDRLLNNVFQGDKGDKVSRGRRRSPCAQGIPTRTRTARTRSQRS